MYEIFEKLCTENNITPYKVSKDTGISTAVFSNWKSGRFIPKLDKIKIIADYFGVTVEYIMTGNEDFKDKISKSQSIIMLDIEHTKIYENFSINQQKRLTKIFEELIDIINSSKE